METPLNQLLSLSGKTAIVTGGAQGIGLGIVQRLAEAGANIVIADLDGELAKKTSDELNGKGFKTVGVTCNVSQEENVTALVNQAVSLFGSVDILVNDAGIFPPIPISEMTSADFDKVIAVNLKGAFLCMKYCAEQMIKQGRGGKIINITSIDALHPSMTGLAHYDASKHGLWGLTKNAALEYAQHKIWVNAIAPGAISTPGVAKMQQGPQGADQEKNMESFLSKIPMHRMGQPDDIARVALFLASELSSYMTGSQIVADGGVLLM